MGSPVLWVTLLYGLLHPFSVQTQEMIEDQDALCNENSCLVIYMQPKTFLDAWRSCKNQGGNLVTIKSQEEAGMVETLFSNMELTEGSSVFVWIGLQRQPRKCSASRPMRGFSWVTGEQDTQYTNWQQEDSPNTCPLLRCVGIGYSRVAQKSQDNFKWQDGPCSVPVDGYVCRYTFPGMCQEVPNEGFGNALYTTPFHLVTSFLSHIPFGSVATVPCLTTVDQTLLCTQREDGTVGWNAEPPYCTDASKTSWCDKDNGGCHHYCIDDEEHYSCDCNEGFLLAEDGLSCIQIDPCQGSPCEFECLTVMDSYRCACPEGYMLAPDEKGCLDVDECLQSPCEHICVNAPGTFECRCRDGYRQDEEGACEDVDECAESPCEHACENVMGSHVCHCHIGFAPLPEDPTRCHDVDECQIEGTCEQMCINYNGGFECYCEEGYTLQTDNYSCRLSNEDLQSPTVTDSIPLTTHFPYRMTEPHDLVYLRPQETESLDWLTEPPNIQVIPTDLLWLTSATQRVSETTPPTESSTGTVKIELDDFGSQTSTVEESLSFTTSTPLPDYYEDESTTELTELTEPPTTTVADEAGNVMGFSPTTKDIYVYDNAPSSLTFSEDYVHESTTFYTDLQTITQFLLSTQGSEDYKSDEAMQGNSWLLVGLLVPLCIFIAIMVALGIVYCIRCTSKPQNKNTTECYHWIAGAGDKAAADMPGGGVTKV
ncbi:CD248 molecule, endosialin a [Trichomycterus rosablanca]|uniref:CD248 molecule, endosialin a n=1 Tax=Trichomycterus rosablanca TaxID=2290929 RepID=UPI002F35C864